MDWTGFRYRIKIEFQDVLAIIFVGFFFFVTMSSYLGWRDPEYRLVQILVPLITIILGGYFGQGAISRWRNGGVQDDKEQRPTI